MPYRCSYYNERFNPLKGLRKVIQVNLTVNYDAHERVYVLKIADLEMHTMDLDEMDKRLIKECESSKLISDKLLALECIARNIERKKLTLSKDSAQS